MKNENQILRIIICLALALGIRFLVVDKLLDNSLVWLQILAIALIFVVGIGYIFQKTAAVIEETTDVLKDRTKLAGGLLQSFGTAFPDMVIGVMAAFISLKVRDADYARSINLAIIAAATTFGSNIYNILHAAWCVYRQNIANLQNKAILMFPVLGGGSLKPFHEHKIKPSLKEMDNALRILTILTLLTAFTAITMVLFGKVKNIPDQITGDLYALIAPVGIVLFFLCVGVLYYFRKSHHPESPIEEILEEENYYHKQKSWRLWLDLLFSGVAILLTAESMVRAIEVFSHITHIPFIITGLMAGLIGCFGEMLVVHNFSIHPKGRIGDAIVGVAMDNIVTTMGAAIVAVMGGIFLGGNALILIFVIILATNTILIEQISILKNNLSSARRE